MAQIVSLPVGVPWFTEQVELDGVTFTLEFRWNARSGAWYAHLQNADGLPLVSGRKVVANWPIFHRFAREDLPAGQLLTIDTSKRGEDPGLDDLGRRVLLVYIPAAELP